MAFKDLEVVRIIKSPKFPHLLGKSGVIFGSSEENGHIFGYGVRPEGEDCSYHFNPEELEGTGIVRDESEFYDGESIRVRVVDGRGYLVNEDGSIDISE